MRKIIQIMKIYTKTGDTGTTSLVGGVRTSKDDSRLNAYGTIDELNSYLGLLRAKTTETRIKEVILDIQNTLFAVGAHLATDKTRTKVSEYAQINDKKVDDLEKLIDEFQLSLPQLTSFIVYGEDELSAICHICRAVSRRAEREIITVTQIDTVDNNIMSYINRLSDFLFVLARIYTKMQNKDEFFWKK